MDLFKNKIDKYQKGGLHISKKYMDFPLASLSTGHLICFALDGKLIQSFIISIQVAASAECKFDTDQKICTPPDGDIDCRNCGVYYKLEQGDSFQCVRSDVQMATTAASRYPCVFLVRKLPNTAVGVVTTIAHLVAITAMIRTR